MSRSQFEIQEADESSNWERQANCKGKATELFEYSDKDSPAAKNMSFKARLAFNMQNFMLAEDICIECPVMFQCLESATSEDKYWTVRGGEPPGRFDVEAEQYEKKLAEGALGKARTCKNGHFLPDGGRCKSCAALRQKALRASKRDAVR